MNIALPVAQYHPGHASDYILDALKQLGHTCEILSAEQFLDSCPLNKHDLYLCIDSGLPINLSDHRLTGLSLKKVAFWFIDFRHNKSRPERIPNDLENAKTLQQQDGWILQAQYEDWLECSQLGLSNCSFLPLAADCNVWQNNPSQEKIYELGFVGNLWDQTRLAALQTIQRAGVRLAFAGPGKAWKERAAALLQRCKMGFNISSFYGTAVSFDVNLRVFETLSCGLPLITNAVPSLKRIFKEGAPFIKTYNSLSEIVPTIQEALSDSDFLSSGTQARAWVEHNASYKLRIQEALTILAKR